MVLFGVYEDMKVLPCFSERGLLSTVTAYLGSVTKSQFLEKLITGN